MALKRMDLKQMLEWIDDREFEFDDELRVLLSPIYRRARIGDRTAAPVRLEHQNVGERRKSCQRDLIGRDVQDAHTLIDRANNATGAERMAVLNELYRKLVEGNKRG